MRARSGAIITGVDAVLIDDPSLTVRPEVWTDQNEWPEVLNEPIQPLRVILDSQLRTPVTAKMLTLPGNTLIVCATENPQRQAALEATGAEVLCLPDKEKAPKVDLCTLLVELARREVNEVLVETGATTAGAFVQQGLVDEWVLYKAPTLMGSCLLDPTDHAKEKTQ